MKAGIIGLPNVGKSTLFSCLTKRKVDISNYPFSTIKPNRGIVEIPDLRLKQLANILRPKQVIPGIIEFVDIAGLVKNAHQGEGLGNQFLSHIREMDILIHLVRLFESRNVSHIYSTVDPQRDIELVKYELLMKDLEIIHRVLAKIEKKGRTEKDRAMIQLTQVLKKIQSSLQKGEAVDLSFKEQELITDYNFLSLKPLIYLFNISDSGCRSFDDKESKMKELIKSCKISLKQSLCLCLKTESELTGLSDKEQKELGIKSKLDLLIEKSYKVLNWVTFFTIEHNILQSWSVQKEVPLFEAVAKIHSDFQEKFIRAEIIKSKDLIQIGSEAGVREQGLVKIVGKDYLLEEGDIVKVFI